MAVALCSAHSREIESARNSCVGRPTRTSPWPRRSLAAPARVGCGWQCIVACRWDAGAEVETTRGCVHKTKLGARYMVGGRTTTLHSTTHHFIHAPCIRVAAPSASVSASTISPGSTLHAYVWLSRVQVFPRAQSVLAVSTSCQLIAGTGLDPGLRLVSIGCGSEQRPYAGLREQHSHQTELE
jgi:hypothetical protein